MSDNDKKDNVIGIRPGIGPGQLKPMPQCPPHNPHPVHMDWNVQEARKLVPTFIRIYLCEECGLVYWEELKSNKEPAA
jgi:hypothetical protein